jgi:molybdate transport system regulatory protein
MITAIEVGAVMALVKVDLDGGQQVTASVTKAAVEELDLTVGSAVTAVIKSTEVRIGIE